MRQKSIEGFLSCKSNDINNFLSFPGYYKREYISNLSIAKAIEHYEKFLDLWKDADSGIPEVVDIMKRLAGLQE